MDKSGEQGCWSTTEAALLYLQMKQLFDENFVSETDIKKCIAENNKIATCAKALAAVGARNLELFCHRMLRDQFPLLDQKTLDDQLRISEFNLVHACAALDKQEATEVKSTKT